MAQFAYFEADRAADEHWSSPRKILRLSESSTGASVGQTQTIVHDISETGLLLESDLKLEEGEELDVVQARAAARRVTVAWSSGRFFGCRFAEQLPVEEPALTKPSRMEAIPKKGSPEAVTLAAVQLHELSMAIEKISKVLDRAMDQLSKREL